MTYALIYLVVGIFAGLTAGLLGIGGGIVNVPALDIIFARQGISPEITFHMALGTSLAIIVITSSSAAYAHYRKGKINIRFAWRTGLSGVGGAVLGGYLASLQPASVLEPAFGGLLILAGVRLLTDRLPEGGQERSDFRLAALIGIVSGVGSGFFGVGGGIIAVPLLIWLVRMSPLNAVATSSMIIVMLSIFGAGTYAVTGFHVTADIPYALGYVHLLALIFVAPLSILTARLGVWVAHKIDPLWLKRLVAGMSFVVGGRFVWLAFNGG